jgi:hypothetical protein
MKLKDTGFHAARIWINGRVVLVTGSGGFVFSMRWHGVYSRFGIWRYGLRWHASRGD